MYIPWGVQQGYTQGGVHSPVYPERGIAQYTPREAYPAYTPREAYPAYTPRERLYTLGYTQGEAIHPRIYPGEAYTQFIPRRGIYPVYTQDRL